MTTNFSNKTSILSELWMNYRDDEGLQDFIEYNDLGLPLAYFIYNELVLPTKQSEVYIEETFNLLIAALQVEDTGFESLDEMLGAANQND
ncbi:MAG: hypothetical protein EB127_20325 [Alphaproteobacteria bacterium]|nr:hypothetical protein [Alphaproteobacteria bacterium]